MKKKVWTESDGEYFKSEQEYLDSDFRYPENGELNLGMEIYGVGWDGEFQKGIIEGNRRNGQLIVMFENEHGGTKQLYKPAHDAPAFTWRTVYSPIYLKKENNESHDY